MSGGVRQFRLSDMVGGWFVGDFAPSAHRTAEAEVAVKHYRRGDTEERHEHRKATEVTLIVSGRARMCGREVEAGDILVLDPGAATDFAALTDCTTVAVKTPSVLGDKYLVPLGPTGAENAENSENVETTEERS